MAVAADGSGMAAGLNRSILFMLGMVVLIPGVFALLVWNSYRAQRSVQGKGFAPEGKLRWEETSR